MDVPETFSFDSQLKHFRYLATLLVIFLFSVKHKKICPEIIFLSGLLVSYPDIIVNDITENKHKTYALYMCTYTSCKGEFLYSLYIKFISLNRF